MSNRHAPLDRLSFRRRWRDVRRDRVRRRRRRRAAARWRNWMRRTARRARRQSLIRRDRVGCHRPLLPRLMHRNDDRRGILRRNRWHRRLRPHLWGHRGSAFWRQRDRVARAHRRAAAAARWQSLVGIRRQAVIRVGRMIDRMRWPPVIGMAGMVDRMRRTARRARRQPLIGIRRQAMIGIRRHRRDRMRWRTRYATAQRRDEGKKRLWHQSLLFGFVVKLHRPWTHRARGPRPSSSRGSPAIRDSAHCPSAGSPRRHRPASESDRR